MPTELSMIVEAKPGGGFNIDWKRPKYFSGLIMETDPNVAENIVKTQEQLELRACIGLRMRIERMLAAEMRLYEGRKAIDVEHKVKEEKDAKGTDSGRSDEKVEQRNVGEDGGAVAPQHGQPDWHKTASVTRGGEGVGVPNAGEPTVPAGGPDVQAGP